MLLSCIWAVRREEYVFIWICASRSAVSGYLDDAKFGFSKVTCPVWRRYSLDTSAQVTQPANLLVGDVYLCDYNGSQVRQEEEVLSLQL